MRNDLNPSETNIYEIWQPSLVASYKSLNVQVCKFCFGPYLKCFGTFPFEFEMFQL